MLPDYMFSLDRGDIHIHSLPLYVSGTSHVLHTIPGAGDTAISQGRWPNAENSKGPSQVSLFAKHWQRLVRS